MDPLFLYEAYREQITLTPVEEVAEASFTHNYNNGNYQNSVVRISMGGRNVTVVTLTNEARAEQMVVYLNYLAWARGPDGGERANLAPATLGGLAKYVANNDHEPLDAESNINLNLIELDITEVPEEPTREGRSIPGVLPYIFMLIFAVLCFFFMAYVVNPPIRDDAIYDAVMKEPSVEPRFLRAYLVDPRNTMHRDEVTKKLSEFYTAPINHVKQNKKGPGVERRDGEDAGIAPHCRPTDCLDTRDRRGHPGRKRGVQIDPREPASHRIRDGCEQGVFGSAVGPAGATAAGHCVQGTTATDRRAVNRVHRTAGGGRSGSLQH